MDLVFREVLVSVEDHLLLEKPEQVVVAQAKQDSPEPAVPKEATD